MVLNSAGGESSDGLPELLKRVRSRRGDNPAAAFGLAGCGHDLIVRRGTGFRARDWGVLLLQRSIQAIQFSLFVRDPGQPALAGRSGAFRAPTETGKAPAFGISIASPSVNERGLVCLGRKHWVPAVIGR